MKKEDYIKLFIIVVFILGFLLFLTTKNERIECSDEACLYDNFIKCHPASLHVEPYDKIGISNIEILGFEKGKCKYWIISTPHASDIPQIKKGEIPMDSLNQETFNKIIEEAKNM